MATYKGIVREGKLIRSNNRGVKVKLSDKQHTNIKFPKKVKKAYIQATPMWIGDVISSMAVFPTGSESPKTIVFRYDYPEAVDVSTGSFYFYVEI